MALTNIDVDGAWTLQSQNTALEGRQMVGGFWAQANVQNSALQPMAVWRQGVVPSSSNAGTYYDLVVAPTATPSLSLLVYSGTFVASRASQAVYHAYNVATRTVTVANADPTNPRLDLIVARVEDAGVGDAATRAQIQVITGTPAASPTAPALPTGAVPLATARVNALATTITTANLTDMRRSVAVNGSVRRLLPGDSLADPGFRDGELRDTGTTIDRWMDATSSWFTVAVTGASLGYAEYSHTVAQTVTTSVDTKMLFDTAVVPSADISYSAGVFTVNRPGVWEVAGTMRWTAPGGAGAFERAAILSTTSATSYRFGGSNNFDGGPVPLQLGFAGKKRFAVGDVFSLWLWQAAGGNLDTSVGLGPNRIQMAWMRP
jgi:hypothetical protein